MIKIYIGKSASGKDTLSRKDIEDGFKPVISYTTRPMRDGETDGVEYYFVTKEKFAELISSDLLTEYRSYNTKVNGVDDVWYYGTPKLKDCDITDYVVILDIKGAEEFIRTYGSSCYITYVYVDDEERKRRAMKRGSFDETEWNRRAADDNIVFAKDEILKLAHLLAKPITVLYNYSSKTTQLIY